jgi:hypothetical protein
MNKINFKSKLQQDNVFPQSSKILLSEKMGMPTRKGLECGIVSGGQLVNVVSNSYGHLPNEQFFKEVENKLIQAGVKYDTRSINRENRSFAVDYILNDDSYIIKVKNGDDLIRPMLRFVNSYDGSCKTSGHFGFFRQICTNGLHVAESKIGFSVKHRGQIAEIVLPEIRTIVAQFMDNEFYTLSKKFEVLAERPISDLRGFVKFVADKTGLFKFEKSDENPEPSLNAQTVIDTVRRESAILGDRPNMWLGYNAFNELLHGKLKKSFEAQKNVDRAVFDG